MTFPLPPNEAERLAALRRYEVLDTPPERPFDDLVKLAALLCQTPMAAVSLSDSDRQWFKARAGLDVEQIPRHGSFCGHVVVDAELLVIEDARRDPRFADHPMVAGEPGVRFYAGAPLLTGDGHSLGTLCVLDAAPRGLDDTQIEGLCALSRQVVGQLELRRALSTLGRERAERDGADCARRMDAIGTLAGGVAHDFNNLLTVIIASSDLLARYLPDTEPLRASAHDIKLAGQRAAELTRQLLAFGRRQRLDRRLVDLNATVDAVLKAAPLALGENIEVRVRPGRDLPPVLADRVQLERVLMTLVVNARDAMPDGGQLSLETRLVTLDQPSLVAHPQARPGRYALIEVRDTGAGIPPEVQARIFEPFFTTKEVGKGRGLGLAVVYGIVAQHEGLIEVDSVVGCGATFRVLLPEASPQS